MTSIHLIAFIDVSTTGSPAYVSKFTRSIYVVDPERYNDDGWSIVDYRIMV